MLQSCNCSVLASAVVWKTRISYVSQDVFSPLNWDFASKTGMATKVCHNIPCCFSMCIFLHIWFGKPFGGVFASPGIRSTLAMDTSSGTLLEVWDGMVFHRRLRPPNNIEWEKHQESIGWGYLHHELLTWFFNHGQMMQAFVVACFLMSSDFLQLLGRHPREKSKSNTLDFTVWVYGKLLNFQPQLQVQWSMSRLFHNPVPDPFFLQLGRVQTVQFRFNRPGKLGIHSDRLAEMSIQLSMQLFTQERLEVEGGWMHEMFLVLIVFIGIHYKSYWNYQGHGVECVWKSAFRRFQVGFLVGFLHLYAWWGENGAFIPGGKEKFLNIVSLDLTMLWKSCWIRALIKRMCSNGHLKVTGEKGLLGDLNWSLATLTSIGIMLVSLLWGIEHVSEPKVWNWGGISQLESKWPCTKCTKSFQKWWSERKLNIRTTHSSIETLFA